MPLKRLDAHFLNLRTLECVLGSVNKNLVKREEDHDFEKLL
jgi:hypothetical protein